MLIVIMTHVFNLASLIVLAISSINGLHDRVNIFMNGPERIKVHLWDCSLGSVFCRPI